jgi:hypothetical protein
VEPRRLAGECTTAILLSMYSGVYKFILLILLVRGAVNAAVSPAVAAAAVAAAVIAVPALVVVTVRSVRLRLNCVCIQLSSCTDEQVVMCLYEQTAQASSSCGGTLHQPSACTQLQYAHLKSIEQIDVALKH